MVDEIVTLYRAVGLDEAADILATGRFRVAPAQAMGDGKWFAETFNDALRWGGLMPLVARPRSFHIARVSLPQDVVGTFLRLARLDGIGPARFVHRDQLPMVNRAGVISLTEADPKEEMR